MQVYVIYSTDMNVFDVLIVLEMTNLLIWDQLLDIITSALLSSHILNTAISLTCS